MCHLEKSVLHDKLLLHKELLQLSDLVGLTISFSQIEPRFRDLAGLIGSLLEILLDDLFELVNPSLAQVVAELRNVGLLDLLELIDLHRLSDTGVVDVSGSDIVALLSNILLGANDFVLDLKGLEAEPGETLREVVHRDCDHS